MAIGGRGVGKLEGGQAIFGRVGSAFWALRGETNQTIHLRADLLAVCLHFCLRRSPDNGTVKVVVVGGGVVVRTIFNFDFFFQDRDIFIKKHL